LADLPAAQERDAASIRALFELAAAAFLHRDLDALMALYVHDNSLFVFDVTRQSPQHVGWDEYRAALAGLFAAIKDPTAFAMRDLQVTVAGDVAYAHSVQEWTAELVKAGTRHVAVRVTDVLRKIHGDWLIVQEHVSLPVDIERV
jgi:ketosteroid isomerase-like protein